MRTTGDPITAALGGRLTPGAAGRAQSTRPATTGRCSSQYCDYLGGILTGDFGTTISDNRPITEMFIDERHGDPGAVDLRA